MHMKCLFSSFVGLRHRTSGTRTWSGKLEMKRTSHLFLQLILFIAFLRFLCLRDRFDEDLLLRLILWLLRHLTWYLRFPVEVASGRLNSTPMETKYLFYATYERPTQQWHAIWNLCSKASHKRNKEHKRGFIGFYSFFMQIENELQAGRNVRSNMEMTSGVWNIFPWISTVSFWFW